MQVPPRGVWGASGRAAHTTAEHWLGRRLAPAPAPDELVLRYLAAFGPASVMDVQTWCGLTRLGEVTERLRPQLEAFRAEDGRELFDLPDAPRPGPDVPAPVRFLYEYDNLLLSHADRSRFFTDEPIEAIAKRRQSVPGAVLMDGLVRASWTVGRDGDTAVLTVRALDRFSPDDEEELCEEGARLLELVAAAAAEHDVRVVRSSAA